jgi:hypothetical protein
MRRGSGRVSVRVVGVVEKVEEVGEVRDLESLRGIVGFFCGNSVGFGRFWSR